jgi:hypothetical protein
MRDAADHPGCHLQVPQQWSASNTNTAVEKLDHRSFFPSTCRCRLTSAVLSFHRPRDRVRVRLNIRRTPLLATPVSRRCVDVCWCQVFKVRANTRCVMRPTTLAAICKFQQAGVRLLQISTPEPQDAMRSSQLIFSTCRCRHSSTVLSFHRPSARVRVRLNIRRTPLLATPVSRRCVLASWCQVFKARANRRCVMRPTTLAAICDFEQVGVRLQTISTTPAISDN